MKYNYIFITHDEYFDDFGIVVVTTNFNKALESAMTINGVLSVWIDEEERELISTNIMNDLSDAYITFTNIKNTEYDDLYQLAFPIINQKKLDFEEKMQKEKEAKNDKIREKELRELERLKAKYETK